MAEKLWGRSVPHVVKNSPTLAQEEKKSLSCYSQSSLALELKHFRIFHKLKVYFHFFNSVHGLQVGGGSEYGGNQ